jgi:hypothetical protein
MPEVLKGVQIGQRLVPSFLVPRSGLKSMCNSCVSVHRSATHSEQRFAPLKVRYHIETKPDLVRADERGKLHGRSHNLICGSARQIYRG